MSWRRISGITKQTLRWSREHPEVAAWVAAGALFEEVMRLFAGKIRNRMVEVSVGAGVGSEVYGVVGQVRQVVANLVSNAVDAVPVGGTGEAGCRGGFKVGWNWW